MILKAVYFYSWECQVRPCCSYVHKCLHDHGLTYFNNSMAKFTHFVLDFHAPEFLNFRERTVSDITGVACKNDQPSLWILANPCNLCASGILKVAWKKAHYQPQCFTHHTPAIQVTWMSQAQRTSFPPQSCFHFVFGNQRLISNY